MSAHTPGPWSAVPLEHLTVICRSGDTENLHIARVRCFAECHCYGDETNQAEPTCSQREANARLIAAAPRMAEILLSAYQHVSHGGPKRGDVEAVLREAGLIS